MGIGHRLETCLDWLIFQPLQVIPMLDIGPMWRCCPSTSQSHNSSCWISILAHLWGKAIGKRTSREMWTFFGFALSLPLFRSFPVLGEAHSLWRNSSFSKRNLLGGFGSISFNFRTPAFTKDRLVRSRCVSSLDGSPADGSRRSWIEGLPQSRRSGLLVPCCSSDMHWWRNAKVTNLSIHIRVHWLYPWWLAIRRFVHLWGNETPAIAETIIPLARAQFCFKI
jgi:hypothetical protein